MRSSTSVSSAHEAVQRVGNDRIATELEVLHAARLLVAGMGDDATVLVDEEDGVEALILRNRRGDLVQARERGRARLFGDLALRRAGVCERLRNVAVDRELDEVRGSLGERRSSSTRRRTGCPRTGLPPRLRALTVVHAVGQVQHEHQGSDDQPEQHVPKTRKQHQVTNWASCSCRTCRTCRTSRPSTLRRPSAAPSKGRCRPSPP